MVLKSYMKTIGLLVCVISYVNAGFCQYIWRPDKRLTYDDSTSYFGYPTQWSIATDTLGRVHVVWSDQRDPQWCSEVYYKRSVDNGENWESDMPLTTNSSYWQEMPCVVTDNQNRVHVVYTEFSNYVVVHYKRSTNGGVSWEPQTDIVNVQGDFAGHTSLASDLADGVYVLYANQTGPGWMNLDNFFVRSTDGGQTWEGSKQLTFSETALWGSIAADTLGRVHVVYVEAPDGERQLYYRRSTNSGQNFEPPVQLTSASSNKFNGSIYTNRGDMVYVVWQDKRDGNWEIYYIRSTDGGTNWGPEIRLTADPDTSIEPNITADLNSGVYLVWTDNRPEKGVYFKYSSDAGNTWSNDTCITNGAVPHISSQFFPSIACGDLGDYLHVAWKDERDGNLEIYYKRRVPEQKIMKNDSRFMEFSGITVYPNPFHSKTTIKFEIRDKFQSLNPLKVYDATGRLVRNLPIHSFTDSPIYQINWSGDDDFGRRLPAGIYFMRLQARNYIETEKVILLR